MNTEARVLAALRKEEPEVIRTHAMSIGANNVDRILGKPPQNNLQMMDKYRRVYPESYIDELNKVMPVILSVIFSRMLKEESNEIVQKLRARKIDVDYLVFDDEGHDVLKFKNRVSCYNKIADFLHKNLGSES